MPNQNHTNQDQPQPHTPLGKTGSQAANKTETDKILRFVKQLSPEEKMLVILKKELYEGSWQAMRNDLENRLQGKPYIFKLANRIQEDMERILTLQKFETENHVDLADYVTISPTP